MSLCHPPWLTTKYTVTKRGAQNSSSCHPNYPGHPERPSWDGWWMLVVCCCGCRQEGHLVLLLAIVTRPHWGAALPLRLRSVRFDDAVMETKWLVKWEHRATFFMSNKHRFYRAFYLYEKIDRFAFLSYFGLKNKRSQFTATVILITKPESTPLPWQLLPFKTCFLQNQPAICGVSHVAACRKESVCCCWEMTACSRRHICVCVCVC